MWKLSNNVLILFCILMILATGCTGTSTTPQMTPTMQVVYETVTVTPTQTIETTQVQTTTVAQIVATDPAIGKRWTYKYNTDFTISGTPIHHEQTLALTMKDGGTVEGTIESKSGATAKINGIWYMDSSTGIYYITPILSMSLINEGSAVYGPAGEQVDSWPNDNWNAESVKFLGYPQIYEMKYMAPNKLVEMSFSNTRPAINGITFTTG